MRFLIIFVLLSLTVTTAYSSNDNIPESAQKEILRIYPSEKITFHKYYAIGDLNTDGIDDLITIIDYKKDNQNFQRLVVLAGANDEKYHFSSQSAPWYEFFRRSISLEIKKSSIFISGRGSTNNTYFGTTYQFRKYDNIFIMIGVASESGTINSDDKRMDSINLLNGKTVTVFIDNGKREELIGKLSNSYKVILEEFSFDNEFEFK
ncbi:MAG: hypothetical protein B7Y56_06860 [Gallionellales bacterium 35-53-114]|jgi:hypothetical protein|nr:MAG: hypothetical protein B7Y56_06860 [Gallionellales bacterium 35-53-114]OYZ63908.1 MAG: hypothetical protein B7Y04_07955 [Gallionellales bacterium 24-53-125]OZB09261.1 MAG: hypothetical protein B7X61_06255 [Gallionellales bacterium 39-52-133]HQS59131.1 hypothetical protein [Gallionellaceae bacterium]HQS75867.1 hypothetical protein [Gallionellaceae bacterium]